jgi:hypothetical protein
VDDTLPGEHSELAAALQALQRALLNHPVATQAAFAALVAEGRRFAQTDEGKEWERGLLGSELLSNGRVVWEVMTQSAFTEHGELLPSVLVDAFARSSAISALEPFLSLLFEEKPA